MDSLASIRVDEDLCFKLWRDGIFINPKNAEHPMAHLYEVQNIKEEILRRHITAGLCWCAGAEGRSTPCQQCWDPQSLCLSTCVCLIASDSVHVRV